MHQRGFVISIIYGELKEIAGSLGSAWNILFAAERLLEIFILDKGKCYLRVTIELDLQNLLAALMESAQNPKKQQQVFQEKSM